MKSASSVANRHAGFTLLELAIVVTIVAVLAGILLIRTLEYREEAERQSVNQTVGLLRVALELRVAKAGGALRRPQLLRLKEENPFEWLEHKPGNYVGEYYSPDLEKIPAGNWVFDRRDKTLIFLLPSHKSFSSAASNLLKFKVEFAQARMPGGKHGPAEVPNGLQIVQVDDQSAASEY